MISDNLGFGIRFRMNVVNEMDELIAKYEGELVSLRNEELIFDNYQAPADQKPVQAIALENLISDLRLAKESYNERLEGQIEENENEIIDHGDFKNH